MKVKDKVIVVTGAGSGVGRALALELMKRGAGGVALADVNEAGMKETLELAGSMAEHMSAHVLNIVDREAVLAFPKEVTDRHGRVDGIINNAGIIQPFIKISDLEFDTVERIMNVNFYGTLHMIKAFLPLLMEAPEAHITNIASMGGFLPVPGQTIYGASKAAVKLMTEGLCAELTGSAVSVSIVLPGAMQTNIMKNSGLDQPGEGEQKAPMKILSPEGAAIKILDAMEKKRCRVILGQDSRLMCFLHRLSPSFAAGLITKKMKNLLETPATAST